MPASCRKTLYLQITKNCHKTQKGKMIQRKQSIFIIIAAILMACLLIWPIDTFGSAQGMAELRWNGVFDITPGSTDPVIRSMAALAFIIIAPIVLNVVGLFLFKRRPLQMRIIGIAAGFELCTVITLVYLSSVTSSGMGAEWHFCVRWIIPVAACVFDVLAYRKISDDEELIRSLNRLR